MAAALAVLVAFVVIVLLIMPMTLPWVAAGNHNQALRVRVNWSRMVSWYHRRAFAIIAVFGSAIVIIFIGIPRLTTDTYLIGFLKKDNPVRLSSDHIQQIYGNYMPLDLLHHH